MDPSLKNLIPCGENLFPCKVSLKVWGKGAFVGCFFFFPLWFFSLRNFSYFGKIKESSDSLRRTVFY